MDLLSFLFGYKPPGRSLGIPVSLGPYNKYMASNVPLALESFKLFKAKFLMSYSASFLKTGTAPRLTAGDLLPGVDLKWAQFILSKTSIVVAARFHAIRNIKQAIDAEARFVLLKVSRGCPACDRVPKERKYKPNQEIPIFPCLGCTQEVGCDVYYTFEF